MSLTQKIAESLKTSDDDVVAMSAVGQVPEMTCLENAMADSIVRLPGIGRELHVVLRI
jgi:hypothetical protein